MLSGGSTEYTLVLGEGPLYSRIQCDGLHFDENIIVTDGWQRLGDDLIAFRFGHGSDSNVLGWDDNFLRHCGSMARRSGVRHSNPNEVRPGFI